MRSRPTTSRRRSPRAKGNHMRQQAPALRSAE
jgi:hypothetical protein